MSRVTGPGHTRRVVAGRELRAIDCDGSPSAVLALGRALAAAMAGTGPALLMLPTGPPAVRQRLLATAQPEHGVDGRAAVVVPTSGSTGEPKLVRLSASAMLASATATLNHLGGNGDWLLTLPAKHVAGLLVLVRAKLAGIDPAVVDLRDGFRPPGFAAAAATLRGRRRYTALVPTQLDRLLDAGGAALDELRRFRAVLLGGAAARPSLIDRARLSGVRVVTTYGMTETAGGCVYDGRPLTGVRVQLDAEQRIRISGPMLADGYHHRPAATAAEFSGGWFRTGDLGRFNPDDRLEVLGRADDLIVTGGLKVAPVTIERALATVPGVAEACVVGVPDPQWGSAVAAAVVPVDPANPPDADRLRSAVRGLAGPAAVPKLIVTVPELPRLELGKVDRDGVRRRVRTDTPESHTP